MRHSLRIAPDKGGAGQRWRRIVLIACGIYLVGYAGYCFPETLGTLRFLMYALPPLLLAPLTSQRSNKPAVAFLLAYLLLVSVSSLTGIIGGEFSRNVIIIALIILCFVPVIKVSVAQIRLLSLCSLVYLFMAYWMAEGGSIRLFQMMENRDWAAFDTGSASGLGYDNNEGGAVGPLYAVFFFAAGEKLQFILAVVMSVLGGKRVGIIALLFGLVATVLFRKITLCERRNRFVALFLVVGALNIVGCNLTSISEYTYDSLQISVSIEEVMLGRYAMGAELNRAMNNRPLVESLFGSGPGGSDTIVAIVSNGATTQLHNDWMKILYDYGIVGSFTMTAFMALVFSTSSTAAAIVIAIATVMCTDNVLIYLYYQFPAALMVAYSASRESSDRNVAPLSRG
jgi:hypothetical protein